VHGVGALFAALDLLRSNRRLLRYVVTPILVSLVVAAVLYGTLVASGLSLIRRLAPEGGGDDPLVALLQVLLVITLLLAVGFLLTRFGVVLGSPWYARLSDEVERIRTGRVRDPQPFSLRASTKDLSRAVGYELRKLVLVLVAGLLLLLLQVVPVLGQLTGTAGAFSVATLVACLDFFDGPLERDRLTFGRKVGFIRRTAPSSLGFGALAAFLGAIPLLNLFAIPVLVTAGTLFVVDHRPPTPPPR
jgi:CysZ protein